MKTLIMMPILFCAMACATAAESTPAPVAKGAVLSKSAEFLGRQVALPAGQWKVTNDQGANANSNLGPSGQIRTITLMANTPTGSPINNLLVSIQTSKGADSWKTACDTQKDTSYGYHEYSGGGFSYPRCSFLNIQKINGNSYLGGTITFTSSDTAISVRTLIKPESFGQTLAAQLDPSQLDAQQKAFYDTLNHWLIAYGNEVVNSTTNKSFQNIELPLINTTTGTEWTYDEHPAPSQFAKLDDLAAVPFIKEEIRSKYAEFLQQPKPRAFAISAAGIWAWSSKTKNAAHNALIRCQKNSPKEPCKLYAVDDDVVWVR